MSQQAADILSLVIGLISIGMSIAIEFPQLYSIFKTKNTSGTSLTTYILFLLASFLWFTWATVFYLAHVVEPDVDMSTTHLASFYPALVSNTINICLVGTILFFKIRNLRICKAQNITEIELSKRIFDKQINYSWIKKYYPLFIIAGYTLVIVTVVVLSFALSYVPYEVSEDQFKKYSRIVLVFNIVAAVFFETVSWPQFFKCMKYKDTSGMSLFWAIFFPLSCFVCFSYNLMMAITTNDFLSVLASLICSGTIINTLVLIVKIKNVRKAKALGISEWKYTRKYLDKKAENK